MKKQKDLFKKGSILLCFIFAIAAVSCVNQINDEIRESNIPISFVAKASKGNTKITKNTFETGDRMGVFAMLTGNGLSEQRYIDTDSQERSFLSGRRCHSGFYKLLSLSGSRNGRRQFFTACHSTGGSEQILQLQLIRFHDSTNRKHCQQ